MHLLISFIAAIALLAFLVGILGVFCNLGCIGFAMFPGVLFLLIPLILFMFFLDKLFLSQSVVLRIIPEILFGIGLLILIVIITIVFKIHLPDWIFLPH